ncbi:hypothetical protein DE146DRAFT_275731 [Phaeosphaeria sp. MPI-PUGE-AT-0046c]|nr:hypothetical protein DE146DRAFT_275731 [Phaeosphaeria sp. MPI-PUGE-AT-0046c]
MTRSILFRTTLALYLPSIVSSAVLPVVGSPRFDVAVTSAALTDTDRLDPFAVDGSPRSIVVSSFSPVQQCHEKHEIPYMPPATASFQDSKFGAYGLPNGSFPSLSLETCKVGSIKRSTCSPVDLPLVVFSGALATSRLLYSSVLQNIAAAGYLVVSVDHPYDSDIVEYPDGTVIMGIDLESDADIELALTTRVGDLDFVRSQMSNTTVTDMLFPAQIQSQQVPKTAYIGHSLGGAAAAAATLLDPTISAGLNLDGTMFGDILTVGLDRPFMLMGHENKTQETDPSWKAVWPLLSGWKKELEVKGAAHYSFSDLPLITAVLGLQELLPEEVGQVLGTVEGHHMTDLIATYATAFLDMVFKSGSEALLTGSSAEFPEVIIAA